MGCFDAILGVRFSIGRSHDPGRGENIGVISSRWSGGLVQGDPGPHALPGSAAPSGCEHPFPVWLDCRQLYLRRGRERDAWGATLVTADQFCDDFRHDCLRSGELTTARFPLFTAPSLCFGM